MAQLHSLIKLPYTSSASRNVYRFKTNRTWYWKAPQLSAKLKWNAGRNDTGTQVIRTKGALLHKFRTIRINYNYTFAKASFISNFLFIPYRNVLLSLMRYSNGALSYQLTAENYKLLTLFFCPWKKDKRFPITQKFFGRLCSYSNLTYISLLEIAPGRGAQYCRSSGTISKILKFDYKTLTTLVRLPSGRSKAFSCASFATKDRILFKENRKFKNSTAGYWRGFGFKSIVRGVAMNPVDHPHGGRTNSIKYPRTPWGKTTKFK